MEVAPKTTAEARKAFAGKTGLGLTGALDYQPRDDKICYNPESVSLSWAIAQKDRVPGAQLSGNRCRRRWQHTAVDGYCCSTAGIAMIST